MGIIVFWILLGAVIVFLLFPAIRRRFGIGVVRGGSGHRRMRRVEIDSDDGDDESSGSPSS